MGTTVNNGSNTPPRILLAEDDGETRELLGQMLDALGYSLVLAEDGQQALDMIHTTPPDLVITDALMPGLDGFELCSRLKGDRHTRQIPVVLLTGLGGMEDRVKGIEAGADDFIGKPFQIAELSARLRNLLRVKQYADELRRAEEVIVSLALAVEAKDVYTEGHCQRLARYSVEVGNRLGLAEEELQALRLGAILHDIGKIGIPDTVLLKPGPLDRDELMVMRSHPKRGYDICRPLRSLRAALPIILHHHERMDGNGYPDGLGEDDIPLGARIVGAVDLADALLTDRPYRKALSVEDALAQLQEAVEEGHLDPLVVNHVAGILAEVGSSWTARTNPLVNHLK